MGPEWRSKWICLCLVAFQILLSTVCSQWTWTTYLGMMYVVGATITQALFLAVHELAHNLFFASSVHNRWFSILANLPIGIPFAISFRGYHLEHHRYQGVHGIDTDLPSRVELALVRGSLGKTIWCTLQIVSYALRPCLTRPQPPTRWHVCNVVTQLVFDAVVVYHCGWAPLWWMLGCVMMAGGLHPCAGHFLSEHYVVSDSMQETYSYYGPLNCLTWNVGYHNEHHDFPNVAWSRLPKLSRVARVHYASLATCESWVGLQWSYIRRPDIGPWSRVAR